MMKREKEGSQKPKQRRRRRRLSCSPSDVPVKLCQTSLKLLQQRQVALERRQVPHKFGLLPAEIFGYFLFAATKGNQRTRAGPSQDGEDGDSSSKQDGDGEASRSQARAASSAPPAPSASDESTGSSEPGGRGRSPRGRRISSPTAPAGACPDAGRSRFHSPRARPSPRFLLWQPCSWSRGKRSKIPLPSTSSFSARRFDREAGDRSL